MSEIVLYVDPPWKQLKGGLRKTRPNQQRHLDYPTMDIDSISDIVHSFNASTVFLWTIDKFLHQAEQMMADYKLHARFIWDKENGVAPAFTVRFSHEYLLWFYRSPMMKTSRETQGKYTTVLREKSTKHSRKPGVARKMIESFYPEQRKIELFAREKHEGWDVWGNEVESDIELSQAIRDRLERK
jgi:N6-adenosine-specific RNA methylase IME4